MTEILAQAALWSVLALIATLLSIWLRVATVLSEMVVGTIAQLIIGALLTGDSIWLKFLSGAGAMLLPAPWCSARYGRALVRLRPLVFPLPVPCWRHCCLNSGWYARDHNSAICCS